MLIAAVKGKARIHFPGRSEEFAEGDLVLNAPHTPFRLTTLPNWSLTFIAVQCNIVIAPSVKENPWLRMNLPQIIPLPESTILQESYRELRRLYCPPGPMELFPRTFRLAFNCVLQPLLSWYLMEGFRSGALEISDPIPTHLYETHRYMVRNLKEFDLTVEELARRVGKDTSQFIQEYRKYYGDTPAQSLQKMRVQKATLLLQGNPDFGLDHIARRCGYRNRSSLHRQFKKHMGISPGEFRKPH